MDKIFNPIIGVMCVAMVLLLSSCGSSTLDREISDALISGDTTAARFEAIAEIILADTDGYSQFVTNGEINGEALQSHINSVGAQLRPPMAWDISRYVSGTLSLSVYFERSGSMVPYDSSSGRGQLKKAVNDIINFFPFRENVSINIVNDSIYPYSGSIESFLQDRDIYASTAGVGNTAFTDFALIFNKILEAQPATDVAVLITDLIYSPANTAGVSTEKIFNEENSLATSIFKKYKNKSVIVSRIMGDYNGKYYPYNNNAFNYNGRRPFFVIAIADRRVIDRIATDPQYSHIIHPDNATHSFRFNQAHADVSYTVIDDWAENMGRFRVSHDNPSELNSCEGDRTTGRFTVAIAANLSTLGKDDEFLTNVDNYTLLSRNELTMKVERITPDMITGNNKYYLEGNSHIITLSGKLTAAHDDVVIALRNEYPQWVEQVSSVDDTNPATTHFGDTTFGLNSFLSGIFNAFATGGDKYATISLKLNI